MSQLFYTDFKSKMEEEGQERGLKSPSDETMQDDVTQKKAHAAQEESLVPLKEDLAEWLSKILGIDVNADTFMDVLDNGVYLCDLSNVIHKKAEECVQEGKCIDDIPKVKLKCKRNAQSGSWFARDNTANFLKRCKAFGMNPECTFESEDLVSHKSERQVVITLLELARIGYKYGLEPPNIIKIEKEIEKEEEPIIEEPPRIEEPPPPPPPPQPVEKSPEKSKPLNLDAEVRRIAAKCQCSEYVQRIKEGTYSVFGKVVIIRLLKNRHLMVRVGGGWETLEHYLVKHNPVVVVEHKRKKSIDFLNGADSFIDGGIYSAYLLHTYFIFNSYYNIKVYVQGDENTYYYKNNSATSPASSASGNDENDASKESVGVFEI